MQATKSWHPWIDQTKFEPHDQGDTLSYVIEIIDDYKNNPGPRACAPAIVFDLDSTLFEVRTRTLRLIKEFARSKVGEAYPQSLKSWCANLRVPQITYTLDELIERESFPRQVPRSLDFFQEMKNFWWQRFLSNDYLLHDVPAAGAGHYVRSIWSRGALVIYLTGRDLPNMEHGTRMALRHWGFPLGGQTTLLAMKPNSREDDAEFKGKFLSKIRDEMNVLAIFDNEPANFSAFENFLPEAKLIFRHSTCSQKPASPVKQVFKIHDFQI